jgi:hypothetical protein
VTLAGLQEVASAAGQLMLVVGVALLATAGLAVMPAALRARRRALALSSTVLASRHDLIDALDRMSDSVSEAGGHVAAVARVLRWLRHPLVAATLQWYLRRRRG